MNETNSNKSRQLMAKEACQYCHLYADCNKKDYPDKHCRYGYHPYRWR